jgi:hypothetical protein
VRETIGSVRYYSIYYKIVKKEIKKPEPISISINPIVYISDIFGRVGYNNIISQGGEMVDAYGLGPYPALRDGGSIPLPGTNPCIT